MTTDINGGLERALAITREFNELRGNYNATSDMVEELNASMRAYLGPFWVDPLPRQNLEDNALADGYHRGFTPIGYYASSSSTIISWEHEGRRVTSLVRQLRDEMLEQLAQWLVGRFGAKMKRVPKKVFDGARDLSVDFKATYHGGMCKAVDSENKDWSGCSKPLSDSNTWCNEEQFMGATFPSGTKITCLLPRVRIAVKTVAEDGPPPPASLKCVQAPREHTVPSLEMDTILYTSFPEHPIVNLYSPRSRRSNINTTCAPWEEDEVTVKKAPVKVEPPKASLDWYLDK